MLALQSLLLWLAIQWQKSRHQQSFADKHLLPWIQVDNNHKLWQKIFSRDVAYSLAWIGFALALAGPQIPDKSRVNADSTKLDVMLVMDLSRSMYATDIKPSRLRRAVLEAYEFLSIAKSMRVGVVVYAARPHLYVPPTNDFNALKFYLKDLDTMALPTQGSDPASAIRFSQKELKKSSGSRKSIVWITDGDLSDKQFESLNHVIQASSINVHSLAIATTEPVAIPLDDGSWLSDKGQGVITTAKLDLLEETIRLTPVAKASLANKRVKTRGGVFTIVADNESDWLSIYNNGILKDLSLAETKNSEQWKSIRLWFLFPAFLLLFVAFFPSLKIIIVFVFLSTIIAFSTANANETYLDELFDGESNYQDQDFNHAKISFIQAVLKANTDNDRAVALHNLGNALFQIGDYTTATQLFSDALRHNAEQKQSQHNQQLSYELYKSLKRRERNQQGSGNAQTPSRNNLEDLPDILPQSLNTVAVDITEYKLPEMPKGDFNRLLKKGLKRLQLMEASGEKSEEKIKQQQNIDEAMLYLMGLSEQRESSSNPLWKRLFEIEEGFPGDLEEPEELPGVQPW